MLIPSVRTGIRHAIEYSRRPLESLAQRWQRRPVAILRGLACAASVLSICSTVMLLNGCAVEGETPGLKIKITPMPPATSTSTPKPGTGTPKQHPFVPGQTIEVWDPNGDGIWDIGYDPLTDEYYRLKRIPKDGGGTPMEMRGLAGMNSFGDGGPVHSDPPDPEPGEEEYDYVIDGCLLGVNALPWNAESAEEFIQEHGLDVDNGEQAALDHATICHSFDTDGEADVTLFWSSDHALVWPIDFNLCYSIHALPSTSPTAPDGLQVRVSGEWRDVARWLIAMGTGEISMPVDDVTWTITPVSGQSAVDVKIDGVYVQTVSLN